ncbi:hypothetical protein [Telluribacter sp.]|jgi:hypothetical protein|uniref:hypothetical protein n=1 Tax=Telluribacter sp. TaxID=1978767 RepID=UPI002E11F323|nr:hypothetical protein [Telluribacter sp.]
MIRYYSFLFILFSVVAGGRPCHAQSTFIPLNDDYHHLIDRLEIKRGKFSEGLHYGVKPFERRAVVQLTDTILKYGGVGLTEVDRATIRYLRDDSWEWTSDTVRTYYNTSPSRLGALPYQKKRERTFWEHPSDLYSLHNDEVDLHVNFATDNIYGAETNTNSALWFTGRGVEIRGMLNQKLGFYTFVADNQGTFPEYVRNYFSQYEKDYTNIFTFPGEGLAKPLRRTGVDFMSARGYITFRPLKSVNLQFGHDRNFIGSGYRSMILSDAHPPYLFLRLDTQLGRFRYTNLWTSMINSQGTSNRDFLRARKYTAMHHLSINLSDRFNVGVFEAEVFSRGDSTGGGGYDLNYLNPIIFYRFVESYIGSEDNALLGFDFRWLLAQRGSLYGQFMMDEFLTRAFFNNQGSWTKKYGLQLGGKYVDAFGIPNVDLQLEYNLVRPYTYSHRDGARNYAHFRQPLAHPLGANFVEVLGILRYKVSPRLTTYFTVMWSDKGLDSFGRNWGGNILLDYDTRFRNLGNYITQGKTTVTKSADLRLSYMLAHNLFIEGRYLGRRVESPLYTLVNSTALGTLAVRYNIPYRQQTF